MAFAGSQTVRPKVRVPTSDPVSQPTEGDFTAVAPVPVEKIEDGVVPQEVTVVQRPEKHGVVDTKKVPLNHLVMHTSGDNWRVNYYRQLLAKGDFLRSLQQGTLPATQSYEEIRNFIIKVTDPLEPDQSSETKEFKVSGRGAITVGINPNDGDMFVADIGNGRTGILVITNTIRKMYNKLAVYEFDISLVAEFENEWVDDLTSKISRTLYFEPRLVEMYSNPFLTPEDYDTFVSIDELEYQLSELFRSRFWSLQVGSLSVPNRLKELWYDNYHARFCRAIGLEELNKEIGLFQNGLLDPDRPMTIWDLILEMNDFQLDYVHKEFRVTETNALNQQPTSRSIAWTNYNKTIYPIGLIDGLDVYYENTGFKMQPEEYDELPSKMVNDVPVPFFWPVAKDDTYVFSNAFYERDRANMSILEIYTLDMLEGKPVPARKAQELAQVISRVKHLDQFYYIPVVLTIMQYSQGKGD